MSFFKNFGIGNTFMIFLCVTIILFAEYLFLTGHEIHGIFVGLWAPTLLGFIIFIKIVSNGNK